jgi:hypothetical protein
LLFLLLALQDKFLGLLELPSDFTASKRANAERDE